MAALEQEIVKTEVPDTSLSDDVAHGVQLTEQPVQRIQASVAPGVLSPFQSFFSKYVERTAGKAREQVGRLPLIGHALQEADIDGRLVEYPVHAVVTGGILGATLIGYAAGHVWQGKGLAVDSLFQSSSEALVTAGVLRVAYMLGFSIFHWGKTDNIKFRIPFTQKHIPISAILSFGCIIPAGASIPMLLTIFAGKLDPENLKRLLGIKDHDPHWRNRPEIPDHEKAFTDQQQQLQDKKVYTQHLLMVSQLQSIRNFQ
jgi:hypothetical protein